MIESYENEIKQVVLNIVNNAKDALIESKNATMQIKINTFEHESFVVVKIEDNGGGIAKKNLEKIFNPYFSTKSKNGTGLGLYMSKTIIEEHCRGKLYVTNLDDNTGAVFTVQLPLAI